MGYEEVSKAYRVFDIAAGQIVITRDVNFDEATFGFSMEKSSEIIKDAIMDLDLLDINEGEVRHVNYKQTCKRKIRPNKQCCSYGSSPSWFKRSKCAGQHV